MSALTTWLLPDKEKGARLANIATEAIQRDLRDNAVGFLRALAALGIYQPVHPEMIEKANCLVEEILKELKIELPTLRENRFLPAAGGMLPAVLNYAGLDAREAAILDISTFGDGRSIEDIQAHVFSLGFEQTRAGQIRSSINASANRDILFKVRGVAPKEEVSLTEEALKIAHKLKRRFGL